MPQPATHVASGRQQYLLAMLGGFLTYRGLLGVIFLASLQGSVVGLTLKGLTGRAGPAAPPKLPPTEGQAANPGAQDETDRGPHLDPRTWGYVCSVVKLI